MDAKPSLCLFRRVAIWTHPKCVLRSEEDSLLNVGPAVRSDPLRGLHRDWGVSFFTLGRRASGFKTLQRYDVGRQERMQPPDVDFSKRVG